jgi:hypothetical protein
VAEAIDVGVGDTGVTVGRRVAVAATGDTVGLGVVVAVAVGGASVEPAGDGSGTAGGTLPQMVSRLTVGGT